MKMDLLRHCKQDERTKRNIARFPTDADDVLQWNFSIHFDTAFPYFANTSTVLANVESDESLHRKLIRKKETIFSLRLFRWKTEDVWQLTS